jgi:hypothetical protein
MAKVRVIVIGVAAYLLSCSSVYSQTLTPEEKMQWFLLRLPFWAVCGFVVGTVVTLMWIRKVKYVPENLSIDGKVRRRFLAALALSLALFGLANWMDLWFVYSSETIIPGPMEALLETWSMWQTFLLMSLSGLTFYVASLLWTRGAFSGRYALWLGPKRN